MRRDLSHFHALFSRVLLFSCVHPPVHILPLSIFLSFSLDSLLTSSTSLWLCLSFSRFPVYFFLLFRRPHILTREIVHHIYGSPSLTPLLSSPCRSPVSPWHKPTSTERHSCVEGSRREKSRNDVTLLGRNRESRVNLGRRDHPVRQEPRVFLDTRADREFQAKSAHQGRRARPGRSGPSARRARQDLQVPRWVWEINPRCISGYTSTIPVFGILRYQISSVSLERAFLGQQSPSWRDRCMPSWKG